MTNNLPSNEDLLAHHIKEALKGHPHAEVRINPNVQAPIPPRIADNILVLLQNTTVTGLQALALVEAYQYVQQFATKQQPQPGVPFPGLTATPPQEG